VTAGPPRRAGCRCSAFPAGRLNGVVPSGSIAGWTLVCGLGWLLLDGEPLGELADSGELGLVVGLPPLGAQGREAKLLAVPLDTSSLRSTHAPGQVPGHLPRVHLPSGRRRATAADSFDDQSEPSWAARQPVDEQYEKEFQTRIRSAGAQVAYRIPGERRCPANFA
jgi:hypothetical protein